MANDLRPLLASLLRDIIGNPFAPPTALPSPLSGAGQEARRMAEAAYQSRPGSVCKECRGKGSTRRAEIYSSRWDREECGACHGTGRIDDGAIDPAALAVIADALEEGGCDDGAILAHLRSPGPHVRGCWPVDFILGKS